MPFIFLPVPTAEMTAFAQQWNTGRVAKGKPAYGVLTPDFVGWKKALRRGLDLGCLRNVPAGDKLYVLAHGNETGSRRIGAARGAAVNSAGNWIGGTWKTYTATQLADVLEAEGLTKAFVDLRVFACGSSLVAPGEAQSFAAGLKIAMNGKNYLHVAVTGYGGAAFTDYDNYLSVHDQNTAHKGVGPPRKMAVRAKDAKQVF